MVEIWIGKVTFCKNFERKIFSNGLHALSLAIQVGSLHSIC